MVYTKGERFERPAPTLTPTPPPPPACSHPGTVMNLQIPECEDRDLTEKGWERMSLSPNLI